MGRGHESCSTQRAATYSKVDYGSRRHRARRHRATLVDEAATRARSSDRAAVERSTASRREVPRPTGRCRSRRSCSGHDTSQVVRFGRILEVRVLAANGNKDISFDYIRLSTEYSKFMLDASLCVVMAF